MIRLAFILAVLAITLSWVLYLITRTPRYKTFAICLGKVTLCLVLIFFGLLAIERLT